MKKFLSVLLCLALMLGILSCVVLADEEDGNLLEAKDATFESGSTNWIAFGSGSVTINDSPSGEGKALLYENPKNSWDSPALDIREIIQSHTEEEATVYIALRVCVPEGNLSATARIRTDKPEDFSMCAEKSVNYCSLGNAVASPGDWQLLQYSFELAEEDLTSGGMWLFCLDGVVRGTNSLYIDDVYVGFEEPEIESEENKELPEAKAITRSDKTLIGTIRWDAFTESTPDGVDPASQVARVLSPAQYHCQAPFFASVNENGTVSFPAYTVETWEQEAAYAVEAGLDYFAYLWYETTDAMSQPRKYHLQSEKKDSILMCGILETLRADATMKELYAAMLDSCYLRLNGRPVVFLYDCDKWERSKVERLRQGAVNAGVEEALYIIGMSSRDDLMYGNVQKGVDAFSWYGVSADKKDMPYEELTAACMKRIDTMGKMAFVMNYQMVPSFTTGRDTRARIQTGVSWVKGDPHAENDKDKPYGNTYTLTASPEAIAAHAADVLQWVRNNEKTTLPNMVCSYGWNEHEEGGWLCPTLRCDENGNVLKNDDGTLQINNDRLEALKTVIDAYRNGTAEPNTDKPTEEPGATPVPEQPTDPEEEAVRQKVSTVLWIGGSVAAVAVIVGVVIEVVRRKTKWQKKDNDKQGK